MPITVRSDFWGNSYAFQRASGAFRKQIAQLLNKPKMRDERAIMNALDGVVPGGSAVAVLRRVQANTQEQGGKRVTENQTLINRVTIAADVTELNAAFYVYNSRPAYPVDKASRW